MKYINDMQKICNSAKKDMTKRFALRMFEDGLSYIKFNNHKGIVVDECFMYPYKMYITNKFISSKVEKRIIIIFKKVDKVGNLLPNNVVKDMLELSIDNIFSMAYLYNLQKKIDNEKIIAKVFGS